MMYHTIMRSMLPAAVVTREPDRTYPCLYLPEVDKKEEFEPYQLGIHDCHRSASCPDGPLETGDAALVFQTVGKITVACDNMVVILCCLREYCGGRRRRMDVHD